MIINYCAAPTGSGKSYAMEGRIAELVNDGAIVLLVQPTKQLTQQTHDNMKVRFGDIYVELLNGDTVEGSAINALTECLKKPYDGPHLIITTWASFIGVPYIDHRSRFHLIFDEVPSGFEAIPKRLPDNHHFITEHVVLEPVNDKWARLVEKREGSLRRISENPRADEAFKIIKPVAEKIYLGKYETFVEIARYEMLLKGSEDDRYLKTFSTIKAETFEGYASVTIIGARADETILFHLLKKQGVKFVEDVNLRRSLRYTCHENGHLIDFYYAYEDNWSLTKQDNAPEMRDLYEEAVIDLFDGKIFCWLDNKAYEGTSRFQLMERGNKLPHSSHGLNSFMCIDHAVILTALNYGRDETSFLLDVMGIDRKSQKIALDYHSTYQAYCRTSVRDTGNERRKIIVVPDRENGLWQQRQFPGSSLRSLGIEWKGKKRGPIPTYASNAERQRAYRERNKSRDEFTSKAGAARYM